MNGSNHIIEKVFLEVNTSKLETAHTLKNNIGEFLRHELFPRLEVLFDEFNLNKTVVRFDEIKLNFSLNEKQDFNGIKYEINRQLLDKLKHQINSLLSTSHVPDQTNKSLNGGFNDREIQKIPITANQEAVFLFFIERGYLPWFGSENQINSFTEQGSWEKSLENSVFIEKLKAVLVREKAAADRFISQFSEEIAVTFLMKINPKIERQKNQLLNLLSDYKTSLNQLLLKLLFQISLQTATILSVKALQLYFQKIIEAQGFESEKSAHISRLKLVKLLRDLLPEKILQDSLIIKMVKILEAESPKKEDLIAAFSAAGREEESRTFQQENQSLLQELQTSFFEKDIDEIAVQNAGLILLHPFLKHFFIKTGIADKQGNFSSENLDLAVQTLHFMATGNENVFEGNLVFEKFLCGVPLKLPIKKQSLLNDEIRNEVQVLLKEVIGNWKALKNSSPNDLRQLFIQRDGKLTQQENKYKLVVERKAQDVLLERISWNISMLKLPWRKELIVVEW